MPNPTVSIGIPSKACEAHAEAKMGERWQRGVVPNRTAEASATSDATTGVVTFTGLAAGRYFCTYLDGSVYRYIQFVSHA